MGIANHQAQCFGTQPSKRCDKLCGLDLPIETNRVALRIPNNGHRVEMNLAMSASIASFIDIRQGT
jgi:hypothetical protein